MAFKRSAVRFRLAPPLSGFQPFSPCTEGLESLNRSVFPCFVALSMSASCSVVTAQGCGYHLRFGTRLSGVLNISLICSHVKFLVDLKGCLLIRWMFFMISQCDWLPYSFIKRDFYVFLCQYVPMVRINNNIRRVERSKAPSERQRARSSFPSSTLSERASGHDAISEHDETGYTRGQDVLCQAVSVQSHAGSRSFRYRPAAQFITQLAATGLGLAQTRSRRRIDSQECGIRYTTMEGLPENMRSFPRHVRDL